MAWLCQVYAYMLMYCTRVYGARNSISWHFDTLDSFYAQKLAFRLFIYRTKRVASDRRSSSVLRAYVLGSLFWRPPAHFFWQLWANGNQTIDKTASPITSFSYSWGPVQCKTAPPYISIFCLEPESSSSRSPGTASWNVNQLHQIPASLFLAVIYANSVSIKVSV